MLYIDIDECLVNNGGCSDNCENTPGGFMCTCNPGFEFPLGETSICTGIHVLMLQTYTMMSMKGCM